MPRPERPLDGRGGPVEQLAAGLRMLREKAGKPGYRQMAARVNYSVATLSAAASGRRLPTLEVTLAYVTACDGDVEEWERRWREAERPVPVPEATDPSPYPGLATFEPEDAELFFGRDALVAELVRRLGERRFLVVFGPSGAGKSSVVRAGLVPAVGGPSMLLTPGPRPMTELAVHLARHAGVPAGGLLDELRAAPSRASLVVRQGRDGAAPLVVVDQFEEVFAAEVDPAERAEFVTALLAMCADPQGARVVLTARADHYARFAEHPPLLAALADAQVLIGGMSPAELREAVTGPAGKRGARVEGALVATIVAQVSDSPGALPLAAHALREAWHRRQGAMVTLAGYQAAGGVAGAVAHTAERAFQALSEQQRPVARRVLLGMVDVGPDGLVTRRRMSHAELETIEQAPAVIEAFTAARLVTTDRETAEIAHEALVRAWPRLHDWVEESRAGLRLHHQLTEAAAVWTALDRDDDALYRGLRLSSALEAAEAGVIDPGAGELEFLEAGRALRDREARLRTRRGRRLSAALLAGLTVLGVLATVAGVSARQAADERDRAMARELAAGARAERLTDPELALLLARRAYGIRADSETESVLRQATTDARTIFTMDGHDTEVYSLAVNRSRAVSADLNGVVKLWDPSGRTPPATVPVTGDLVDIGPDGQLAIAHWVPGQRGHRQIVLWRPGDAPAGRPLSPAGLAGLSDLEFSPDGRWVATIGDDSRIHVWETAQGRLTRSLAYPGTAEDFAFGPAGKLFLASGDGTARIWDVGTSKPPVVLRIPVQEPPASVAFSPDGRLVAVGGWDKVTVLPADGRGTPEEFRGAEFWYGDVVFSPDSRRLAAGTDDRIIRIWDLSADGAGTGPSGLVLRGHRGPVRDLAFSPDGHRLFSGSDDATVRVWDAAASDPAEVAFPTSPGTRTLLSDDGSVMVATTGPGTLAVRPARTPGRATVLRGAPENPQLLAVSAGGRAVAAAARDSEQISWWQMASGEKPAVVECPRTPDLVTTNDADLSDDGRLLVVNCGDGEIRLWRSGDRRAAAVIAGVGPTAVSPDSTRVALVEESPGSQNIQLWDPVTGKVTRTVENRIRPDDLRFSPDGKLLAAAGEDGAIRVWPTDRKADPVKLTGIVERTSTVSFSPDGRMIAGIGTDGSVRLWNTDGSGEALALDHLDARQLAFSADGRRLITLYGASVRFLPCEVCGPIDDVLELADRRTTRDFTAEERAKYLR
ncbi:hypothetical protein JIG36_02910 [Actinoplanes sp. LDG1-06]|uniref:HTH cro/C1-type domain-containing protein n=1 Tax=Paractinoplanes ovalisporus TaxID=2810368 RepID=A0ABS2A3T0_9ACTN|nr:hypothetical protein [Actinoplanes ovalisporus]MBM2614506.1 hypothetical protein [Actinoplanes ovalisporus]